MTSQAFPKTNTEHPQTKFLSYHYTNSQKEGKDV